MSDPIEEYQEMKRIADQAQREKDMAVGAKAAMLKRLKEEFGCADARTAKALLAKKTEIAAKLEAARDKAKEAFREQYGDDS